MNWIAITLGSITILLFVIHALMHSHESEPFHAGSNLSASKISANLSATASSLGTALLFLLFQTPVYGFLIFLIILMFLLGQYLFAHYATSLGEADPEKYGSTYRIVYTGTESRGIAFAANLLNVATYTILLLIELIIGAAILGYAIPGFADSSVIGVAVIMGGVCVYVVFGGFALVAMSDRWQFLFLLISVIVTILFFAAMNIAQEQSVSATEVMSVFAVFPEGGIFVVGTFVLNVIIVNLLLPSCQSASWQRFAASKNAATFKEAYKKSILGQLIWAWLAFAILSAMFYQIYGGIASSPLALFEYIDGTGPLGKFFVAPLLFAGLVAAIVSTADSLLIAFLLGIYDFRRWRGGTSREAEEPKVMSAPVVTSAIAAFVLVVTCYVLFNALTASDRNLIVGLMFAGVGQTVLLAPVIWFCMRRKLKDRLQLEPATTIISLMLGFAALWCFSIYGIYIGDVGFNQIAPIVGLIVTGIGVAIASRRADREQAS